MNHNHILISRTDSIGDVILTLPLAGLLRKQFPHSKISFLGMPYTEEIINCCGHIDQFIDWSKINAMSEHESVEAIRSLNVDTILHVFPRKEIARLAHKSNIAYRLGTTGRSYNWLHCNMLVPLSRRNSSLHEAQLNIRLARRIHGFDIPSLNEIAGLYGFSTKTPPDDSIKDFFSPDYHNIILHPRSKGSAREWGLVNYARLSKALQENSISGTKPYRVYITGTSEEGRMLKNEGFFDYAGEVVDVTGRFTLREFIKFISLADALIAGSTGPLHIAAALGKIAIGLYPPIKPMHPGRWAPIGENATWLVATKDCSECRQTGSCSCMQLISVDQVQQKLSKCL